MAFQNLFVLTYFVFYGYLNYSDAFSNGLSTSCRRGLAHRNLPSFHRHRNIGIVFSTSSNAGKLSEVEALLEKAKKLREQAETAESQLHSSLIKKKTSQDLETDVLIDEIFPLNFHNHKNAAASLAKRIEKRRLSKDMLIRVVERLHNREVAAKGVEHVEPSLHHSHVTFERIASHDEKELNRVEGLIDHLVKAAAILDEIFFEKHGNNEKIVMHHVDHTHWSTGELSKVLREKARFLGREHDEQFKNRIEEYYEAARRKPQKNDKKP